MSIHESADSSSSLEEKGPLCLRPCFVPPGSSLDFADLVQLLTDSGRSDTRSTFRYYDHSRPHASVNPSVPCNAQSIIYSHAPSPTTRLPTARVSSQRLISLFGGDLIVEPDRSTSSLKLPVDYVKSAKSECQTLDIFLGLKDTQAGKSAIHRVGVKRLREAEFSASPNISRAQLSPATIPAILWSICRNVAASERNMSAFLRLLGAARGLSLALVWEHSSSHTRTSEKHCTPSQACALWYCACERNSRLPGIGQPVLVVMVIDDPGNPHADRPYVLPLIPHTDSGVPLRNREALLAEVMGGPCIKCIYNAQLVLLALLQVQPTLIVEHIYDPRIAAYLCATELSGKNLELEALLIKYFCTKEQAIPSAGDALTRNVAVVAGELRAMASLHSALQAKLQEAGMVRLLEVIEMPITASLAHMELCGVGIDLVGLAALESRARAGLSAVAAGVSRLVGREVNLASPEQVSALLFDELQLPVQTWGKRHASTSDEALQRLLDLHPVVPLVLEHRALNKLLTTYVAGFKQYALCSSADRTHRVHAVFTQTVVRTGRLSCCRPNLQSLPNNRTNIAGEKFNLRDVVVASTPGWLLLSADYSQIEMRVLAHVTGDEALRALFVGGGDVYRGLASRIFGRAPEAVSSEERDRAKVICLGSIYGMGVAAAAAKLRISAAQASEITSAFFAQFGRVRAWIEETKRRGRDVGYVETICGRRRYLLDAQDQQGGYRGAADRQAVNSVIQGSASDIIKAAMLAVARALSAVGLTHCRILLQVHDELVIELPADDTQLLRRIAALVREAMEHSVPRELGIDGVPLTVQVTAGLSLGSMLPEE
jgi:DNA polymerase I-like protein with 3'-5' exonuclease and polymerase domains